jgi:hypothetical protein
VEETDDRFPPVSGGDGENSTSHAVDRAGSRNGDVDMEDGEEKDDEGSLEHYDEVNRRGGSGRDKRTRRGNLRVLRGGGRGAVTMPGAWPGAWPGSSITSAVVPGTTAFAAFSALRGFGVGAVDVPVLAVVLHAVGGDGAALRHAFDEEELRPFLGGEAGASTACVLPRASTRWSCAVGVVTKGGTAVDTLQRIGGVVVLGRNG